MLIKPKISIITVSYNCDATIGQTIRSVASQIYPNIEHLIVDGQSVDETIQEVEKNRHPALILYSEPDEGIYDAMNKGLSLATGEIVGFLNADDFFADEKVLERIAESFSESSIEASFGDLLYVTEDTQRVVRHWKSRPFEKGDFARGWCPAHPTFYIRRSALEKMGVFDKSYKLAADAEFMMRYLESGDIRSIYIPHVQIRMRVGGATNQSWRNIVLQNQEIFHALEKNGIPYSAFVFWCHKISNRLWQRVVGFFINNKIE